MSFFWGGRWKAAVARPAMPILAALFMLATPGLARAATTATASFTAPGQHIFSVPPGVTSVTVVAVGATGGSCEGVGGGQGGVVTATVAASGGEPLLVGVGGAGDPCHQPDGGAGGIGGGGNGGRGNNRDGGAGGGGASALGRASSSPGFQGLLVVAAGGGGAGGPGALGSGGGAAGSPGSGGPNQGGGPGTATAGGSGGQPSGVSGSFGLGGTGGNCGSDFTSSGGGGGGGYYGGGGGGGCGGGGGGGGSDFVVPGATGVSTALTSAPPGVSIVYAAPTADESTTSMRFGAQAAGTAGPAQTLTVKNNGSAPLVVSGVLLGGANPDDFLVVDRCQLPVAVGSSCELGVRFHPQTSGARSATLTLLSNAASAPPAVALAAGGSVGGRGPAGRVDVLRCQPTAERARGRAAVAEVCRGRVVRGSVRFTVTGASTRARLVRKAKVFAIGAEVATAHGGLELVLTEKRRVRPGEYTLVLRHRHRGRWITHRLRVAVRR